jgi:diguanylate cyclase (GGDEF)-like protein
MSAEHTPTTTIHGFATRALLWLQMLTLAVGAMQFAFAPATVERPLLAALSLGVLAASTLLVRVVPLLKRSPIRQHWIEIAVLVAVVTLLAIATGAASSRLLPLYLVPLTGVAVASGRWWLVLLLGVAIAALGFVLGALTPELDIASREFGVMLTSVLAPGVAVALLIAALIEQMHGAVRRISDLASTDALTGLLNLRAFEDVLAREHRKAERFGRPYALLMVDVTNTASINETLGHEAGSQIIAAVAAAITRSIRNSDVAARLGGDEFVVVLVEADAETAAAIAQRIRNNVNAGTISVANRLLRANVSVGIAQFPEDHLYPKELMILADQRMQQDRELRRSPAA